MQDVIVVVIIVFIHFEVGTETTSPLLPPMLLLLAPALGPLEAWAALRTRSRTQAHGTNAWGGHVRAKAIP